MRPDSDASWLLWTYLWRTGPNLFHLIFQITLQAVLDHIVISFGHWPWAPSRLDNFRKEKKEYEKSHIFQNWPRKVRRGANISKTLRRRRPWHCSNKLFFRLWPFGPSNTVLYKERDRFPRKTNYETHFLRTRKIVNSAKDSNIFSTQKFPNYGLNLRLKSYGVKLNSLTASAWSLQVRRAGFKLKLLIQIKTLILYKCFNFRWISTYFSAF